MSRKSERKSKARNAQKQAELSNRGFRLINDSFLPDSILQPLLVLGAKAAGANPAALFVHVVESDDDATHTVGREEGERLGLHLTVPPKGDDPLQSATELFRRIVLGWSFITNFQMGNNDQRAACCNECIAVIVKEHVHLIQAFAGVYEKQAA